MQVHGAPFFQRALSDHSSPASSFWELRALPRSSMRCPAQGGSGDWRLSRGVYLVFPFENAGASPRLEWLGEGLEELTIQRLLAAAGEQVYSHAGRVAELERYGLPRSSRFSRATMLHVAEDLDADFVMFRQVHRERNFPDGRVANPESESDETAARPSRNRNSRSLMDLHCACCGERSLLPSHAIR